MKAYECIVILDPKLEEVEVDKIAAKIEDMIQKGGGVLTNTNKWGKKKLAYEIDKVNEAYYVQFNFNAPFEFNKEFIKTVKFINGMIRAMVFNTPVEKKKTRKIATPAPATM